MGQCNVECCYKSGTETTVHTLCATSRAGDGFIRQITNKDDGGVSEEGGEDDDDGGDLHEGAASVSEESKQAEYRGDERVLIH